jgi:hypothetical protein
MHGDLNSRLNSGNVRYHSVQYLLFSRLPYQWWGSLRERDHWGDPDVDGRIILRWMFRKWEGVVGTGWRGGTCEYGNELSGSINAGNFLTSCKTI